MRAGIISPSPLVGEGYEDLVAERLSRSWMGGAKRSFARSLRERTPHPNPSPAKGEGL